MATFLARRSCAHRPVVIADQIFEDAEPGARIRLDALHGDRTHSRFRHAVALGDVVEILEEETDARNIWSAVGVDIIDGREPSAEAHRRHQVEKSVSGIFEQDLLLEIR